MPRISQLPSLTSPDDSDEIAIVDTSAATTKKITREDFFTGAPLPADTITTAAIEDGAVTTPKLSPGSIDGAVVLQDNSVTEVKSIVKSSYSTTEVNTGAKWVDNKNIYKKTISCGALPNSTSKYVAHGITGFENIVEIAGWAKNATPGFIALPYPHPTTSVMVAIYVEGPNIQLTTTGDRSSYTTSYITLWYTKT